MIYENIRTAVFIARPNRFIANILLDDVPTVCHVKNTGRCKELLPPNAKVLVQMSSGKKRKTTCDLIAVWKGDRLINMDALAPNKVFEELLHSGALGFFPHEIKPEWSHGDSRFDFYFEYGEKRCIAEIKGVTLEENGVVRFPDAPTLRGVKHLHGLVQAQREGFETYAVFIVQMRNVKYLEPNWNTQPEFGAALREAKDAGVHLLGFDCDVTYNSITAATNVEIRI